MFFAFLGKSLSIAPVIMVPPMYGTNIWATYNQTDLPKKCRKSMNDSELWFDPYYLIPGKLDCLFSLLTIFSDEEGNPHNYPNVTTSIHDFGGETATRYVAHIPKLNAKFVISFAKAIDTYKAHGYTLKKDLYVIPYDWRLAPTFIDSVYEGYEELIYKAYEENDHQKVTLFGFSMGGYVTQQFLTMKSQEWKDKYIEKVVYMAPSFVGSAEMLYWVYLQRIVILPRYNSPAVNLLMQSWPTIHSHMPNIPLWDNYTVIYGPDGTEYKANDVTRIIKNNSYIDPQFFKMYDKASKVLQDYPKWTGVPTTIVFNSGLPTIDQLNFTDWHKKPITITHEGDGRIPAYPLKKICNEWNNTRCIELHSKKESYDHQPLITNQHVLDIIYNLTTNQEPTFVKGEKWYKQ